MTRGKKQAVLKPHEALVALGQAGEEIASAKAALPIKSILPPQEVTVDNKNISHHFITAKDLTRLRGAADGKMSPWIQLFAGAVVGNILPFGAAVSKLLKTGLSALDTLDVLSMILMSAFASACGAFFFANQKLGRESVQHICDEIEGRETRVVKPDQGN